MLISASSAQSCPCRQRKPMPQPISAHTTGRGRLTMEPSDNRSFQVAKIISSLQRSNNNRGLEAGRRRLHGRPCGRLWKFDAGVETSHRYGRMTTTILSTGSDCMLSSTRPTGWPVRLWGTPGNVVQMSLERNPGMVDRSLPGRIPNTRRGGICLRKAPQSTYCTAFT